MWHAILRPSTCRGCCCFSCCLLGRSTHTHTQTQVAISVCCLSEAEAARTKGASSCNLPEGAGCAVVGAPTGTSPRVRFVLAVVAAGAGSEAAVPGAASLGGVLVASVGAVEDADAAAAPVSPTPAPEAPPRAGPGPGGTSGASTALSSAPPELIWPGPRLASACRCSKVTVGFRALAIILERRDGTWVPGLFTAFTWRSCSATWWVGWGWGNSRVRQCQ